MYRFHIKPIQLANAPSEIAATYHDIQNTLQIETVPLVFQYVANYERYFSYIWHKMKINLLSPEFQHSCEEIRTFADQAVVYFETPSQETTRFVQTMRQEELLQIRHIAQKLDDTNLKMMLLMIGVRESIKGIYHAKKELPGFSDDTQTVDEIFQMKRSTLYDETNVDKAARMLAPLFGGNALMISHYPDFFGHIAGEMERLENMEAYLLTRVGLEHLGFAYIEQFVEPLNCSFIEFMQMTEGNAYVDELLYLLKDTFPSRFPHLVLTTAVMKKVLQRENPSIAVQ